MEESEQSVKMHITGAAGKPPLQDNQTIQMHARPSTYLQLPDPQVTQIQKGQVGPPHQDRIPVTGPSPVIQAQQL